MLGEYHTEYSFDLGQDFAEDWSKGVSWRKKMKTAERDLKLETKLKKKDNPTKQ